VDHDDDVRLYHNENCIKSVDKQRKPRKALSAAEKDAAEKDVTTTP